MIERPYAIKSTSEKYKKIEDLLFIIKEMKRIKFPTNKLRYIYDLKVESTKPSFEKKLQLINTLSKMSKEHIKFIKSNKLKLNLDVDKKFEEDFTNIFDILELYQFIDEDGETNGN